MQRDFYRMKQVCGMLKISHTTLYAKIKSGILPELDRPSPLNTRMVGYTKDKLERVLRSTAIQVS